MFGAKNEIVRGRFMEFIERKREVKMCMYESKTEVSEQFGRMVSEGVSGNRKLFGRKWVR